MDKKEKDLIVRKSNKFIQEFKFSLSKAEIRVVNFIIANIASPLYSEEFNTLDFHISEFYKFLGIKNPSGADYNYVKKLIRGLKKKESDWVTVGEYETIVSWIEKPKFYPKSGRVTLKLDDDLKPYLLKMNGYITAQLQYFFEMESKYSMRLYELLKSYDGFDEKTFEIDELRKSIDALKKSYDSFGKFRQGVLEPAIEEINKITDLFISYDTESRGRKITHIKFYIKRKKDIKSIDEDVIPGQTSIFDEENQKPKEKKFSTVEEMKINYFKPLYDDYEIDDEEVLKLYKRIKRALDPVLLSRLPADQDELIRETIRYLLDKASAYTIRESIFGYMNTMIKNEDWAVYIKKIVEADKEEAERVKKERAAAEAKRRHAEVWEREEAEREARRKEFYSNGIGVDYDE